MASLPSHHYQQVYAAVLGALLSTTKSDNSAKTLEQAIAAVLTCVHEAVADAAQRWNGENEGPVQRLPVELRARCFESLELRDCIAASHVSREWRATALSAPTLWDSFQLTSKREIPRHSEDLLRAMLHRSQAVPFHFRWKCRSPMPQQIFDVLLEALPRIEALIITGHSAALMSTLLARPLPRLRTLHLSKTNGQLLIPSCWTESPPPLQYMSVGEIVLSEEMQPLLHLQTLTCAPPTDASHLFTLCPNVENVTLHCLDEGYRLLETVPRSLQNFTATSGESSLNLLHVIQQWRGHRFQSLNLPCGDLAALLDFFLASGNMCRTMHIKWASDLFTKLAIYAEDEDQCTLETEVLEHDFVPASLHQLAAHLRNLTSLHLDFEDDIVLFCT